MEIKIRDKFKIYDILAAIAEAAGVKVHEDCSELSIQLPAAIGKGQVIAYQFEHGISLLIVNATFKRDFVLRLSGEKVQHLYMNFCMAGRVLHKYDRHKVQYQLDPFQGSMTSASGQFENCFQFPAKMSIRTAHVRINRQKYIQKINCELEEMPEKLSMVMEDEHGKDTFFHQSNYTVLIAECIKSMIETEEIDGLVKTTFLESKVLELISHQLRQYQDDMENPGRQVLIRSYDLEKILQARDLLVKDLKSPPTIPELARQVGINQQKLKKGFKTLFDKTVNKYLRNERLEKASLLLMQGSYSIREVSSAVGYTNASHFANRFREKYGVLPKDYHKHVKVTLSNDN